METESHKKTKSARREQRGGENSVGYFFRLSTTITLVGGTIFLMWLGEQITARGVGNGISLIIFSGIVAELPSAIAGTLELGRTGALSVLVIIGVIVLVLVVVTFIVFVERAQRRIIVQYPKRQVGNQMYGGESSHLPLKINTPGVIPMIFASALLLMPVTTAGFSAGQGPEWLTLVTAYLGRGQPLFLLLYASLSPRLPVNVTLSSIRSSWTRRFRPSKYWGLLDAGPPTMRSRVSGTASSTTGMASMSTCCPFQCSNRPMVVTTLSSGAMENSSRRVVLSSMCSYFAVSMPFSTTVNRSREASNR